MNHIIYTNQGNSSLLSYSIQSNTFMPSTVLPTELTYGEQHCALYSNGQKEESTT
jgi:hypothetical protein